MAGQSPLPRRSPSIERGGAKAPSAVHPIRPASAGRLIPTCFDPRLLYQRHPRAPTGRGNPERYAPSLDRFVAALLGRAGLGWGGRRLGPGLRRGGCMVSAPLYISTIVARRRPGPMACDAMVARSGVMRGDRPATCAQSGQRMARASVPGTGAPSVPGRELSNASSVIG